MATTNLKYFFEPKSIAVIGASRSTKKIGHAILKNLLHGFRGEVYAVNPNADSVLDVKCYPTVKEVPNPVELAIICIRAEFVLKAIEDCAAKGVKAAIIISGGFSEVGNKELENKIAEIAKSVNMRIIGPNCVGCYDAYTRVDSVFLPVYRLGRPHPGKISLISQSGALGGAMLDWANMYGYGFSKFISYGNALDVDETDLVEFLKDDEKTELICIYVEGIADGRKFMEVAKETVKHKPIIAIKGGVTEAGAAAVSSHTGSLAGSSKVYEAAFKQSKIIQANDLEEMLDFARTIVNSMPAKGNRVLTITNGGGLGILTTDAITKNNLKLAKLSETTKQELKKRFPDYVVVGNPIDLTGDADVSRYEIAIDAALNDENVDIIIIDILFQVPTLTSDIVEMISDKFNEQKKPIVVVCFGGDYTIAHKRALEHYGIPTFSYPERAVAAVSCLVKHWNNSNTIKN